MRERALERRKAQLHPDQTALPQGYPAGLDGVLACAARSACLPDPDAMFYYIKLEDEEPCEVTGGPSDDGPPARLRQRPEARPETR